MRAFVGNSESMLNECSTNAYHRLKKSNPAGHKTKITSIRGPVLDEN